MGGGVSSLASRLFLLAGGVAFGQQLAERLSRSAVVAASAARTSSEAAAGDSPSGGASASSPAAGEGTGAIGPS